ncbi:MAG TPA: metallopeptidase TldD-related protein [Candidatus Solibacter sp.]|nr:metallopeptidase TldD-related protein [Candidatus Solibacter sp.]
MLTQKDAKNLIDKVIGASKLPQCQVDVTWTEDAFIRFANNGITTSGYRITQQITISSVTEDKRQGSAVVTEWNDEALQRGRQQAEDLARISKPNPEDMPALGPQKYLTLGNYDNYTAGARGDALIPHVKAVIERAKAGQLTAAGFIQRSSNAVAVGNKGGLFGYHTYTDCSLTNTMRTAGGTSSGWASQTSVSLKDVNGEAVGRISTEKALRGAGKKKNLDPGKYTVILEAAGVSDLMGILAGNFGARGAEQGQSFLSKQGGGTHLGEKMFPEYITLRSDPLDTRLATTPWGPSLLPNQRIPWIDKGVVKNLYYDRFWASKADKEPTPAPCNVVLDGQAHTTEELIAGVERGLLITRLWYIRTLQPQTLQVTGLTRDGVFLVEKGQITDPVTNFRWNESPVRVLQNTKMLGRPSRAQGAESGSSIVPAMVVDDFNLASVSDAV